MNTQKIVSGPSAAQLGECLFGGIANQPVIRLVVVEGQANWYESVRLVSIERADSFGKLFTIKGDSLTKNGRITFSINPRSGAGEVLSRN